MMKRILFFLLILAPHVEALEDLAFIILRHVRVVEQDQLWQNCYHSIRTYYPEAQIVIIDDASSYPSTKLELKNTLLISSEHPGAGELLPYYYAVKHQFAQKIVVLHDSMCLKRPFSQDELSPKAKFHWHFEPSCYTNTHEGIQDLVKHLDSSEELLEWIKEKHWNNGECKYSSFEGCFGVAAIIDLNALLQIENKYHFTRNLAPIIRTRIQREYLERIFALILFQEGLIRKGESSNFGKIQDYPNAYFQTTFSDELKATYPGAILKVWQGR